jgi:hypothetical protein
MKFVLSSAWLIVTCTCVVLHGALAQDPGRAAVDWRHVPDVPPVEREAHERQVAAVMRELLRTNETVNAIVAHPALVSNVGTLVPALDFSLRGPCASIISLYRPRQDFVKGFSLYWLQDLAESAHYQGDYVWKQENKKVEKVAIDAILRWTGVDVLKEDGPWNWTVECRRWTTYHIVRCQSRFHGIPVSLRFIGASIDDRDLRVLSVGASLPPAKELPYELPPLIARDKAEAMAERHRKKHWGHRADAMAARVQDADLEWGAAKEGAAPGFVWIFLYVCTVENSFSTGSFTILVDAVTGEMLGSAY